MIGAKERVGLKSYAVGRRCLLSTCVDEGPNVTFLYPRRRLLGASPSSAGL